MRKPSRLTVFAAILLALLWSLGCSHSPTPVVAAGNSPTDNSPEDSSTDPRPLPFHDGDAGQPVGSDAAAQRQASDSAHAGLPFALATTGTLPAGMLLTVRLRDTLSGTSSSSGAPFVASLDQRVVVNGTTVVARGTTVQGRVESAQASEVKGDRGYVRLTLVSLHVDGREVPLQTSSLFARGEAEMPGKPTTVSYVPVHIQKGRLLTFRLSSTVSFPITDPAQVSKNSLPASD